MAALESSRTGSPEKNNFLQRKRTGKSAMGEKFNPETKRPVEGGVLGNAGVHTTSRSIMERGQNNKKKRSKFTE